MSKSYSIGDLMSIYYEREFSMVKEAVLPDFTVKHNRKMQKVFSTFAANTRKTDSKFGVMGTKKPLSIRKRVILAVIIIVCFAFVTGGIIAFISNSFRGTVYNDNTYLFAFDIGDSPTVIEEDYVLSVVPEGYELYETLTGSVSSSKLYRNHQNKEFVFMQTVKSEYYSHINTEGFAIQEIDINGCNAVCVVYERKTGINTLLVWNNKEYILELYGNITKEELINLANSNEFIGF